MDLFLLFFVVVVALFLASYDFSHHETTTTDWWVGANSLNFSFFKDKAALARHSIMGSLIERLIFHEAASLKMAQKEAIMGYLLQQHRRVPQAIPLYHPAAFGAGHMPPQRFIDKL